MDKKKISVCIPTYNGEKYIKEQIDSILCQLGEDDEIIISDDRSTDRTIEILRSYNDNRIKIYNHQAVESKLNGTYKKIYIVCKNVENALLQATGDYIFLSDQDDVWMPNKISYIMKEFESGFEYVQHDVVVVDKDLNTLFESRWSIDKPNKNIISFIFKCRAQGSAMAFTNNIKVMSLPFPNIPIPHDHWISCCARQNLRNVKFIDCKLIKFRRHENNTSSFLGRTTSPLYVKISYRLITIVAYMLSIFRKKQSL